MIYVIVERVLLVGKLIILAAKSYRETWQLLLLLLLYGASSGLRKLSFMSSENLCVLGFVEGCHRQSYLRSFVIYLLNLLLKIPTKCDNKSLIPHFIKLNFQRLKLSSMLMMIMIKLLIKSLIFHIQMWWKSTLKIDLFSLLRNEREDFK